MAKRTPRQQTKHNKGVSQSAKYYEGQGFNVKAAIPGYKNPPTLGGKIPDVFAKKGKETVVVEIETKETLEKDAKQQEVFKKYADKHKDARFWTKKV